MLASILYKAARERGYVQPSKVRDILGVTKEEIEEPGTGTSGHVTEEAGNIGGTCSEF